MFDVIPITSPRPTDCGATCMKMLLEYYDIHDATLEELIEECHTGIIGCTGRDLLRVGRNHGLDMQAYQMDAEELIRQDRPAIVWWRYQHFVVFCGRSEDGQVVVCNPDLGRYRMPADTFKSFYTDVSFWNGEPEDYMPRATKAIANGEYFTHPNGELCKAIAPIANGAILTLNTNYIVTSVEAELAALNK